MPQSTVEYIQGYLQLILDIFSQRLVNRSPPPNHTLFTSPTYLAAQTAIVTGANTGLGFETARMLCAAGATVVLACRNLDKAFVAADALRAHNKDAALEVMHLDLGDMRSVRNFAHQFMGEDDRELHMLVLNGGVMAAPHVVPDTHFMVNHVGHALLTLLLMPSLSKVSGRVVVVSSLTCLVSDLRLDDLSFQQRRYSWMTAYANSKLSMLLFMRALARRLGKRGVCVNGLHPGEATSDVARYLGRVWMTLHQKVGRLFLLSTSEAARTTVYVAGAREIENVSGELFHRVWHRMELPQRLLMEEDAERVWGLTLQYAGVTEDDLQPLRKEAKKRGGDVVLVRVPE